MRVSAPGKLFLAGEWAILERGNPGIVAAVDKRVFAELEPVAGKYVSVTIDDFRIRDIRYSWNGEKLGLFPLYTVEESATTFLVLAVETALKFLKEKGIEFRPFKIRTWSEGFQVGVERKQRKVGFGSSASSVVAIVKGVLEFHGYPATRDQVYKLSAIAHYVGQGKVGSGFDVAAAVHGGLFMYKRFDGDWLVQKIKDGKSLSALVTEDWPRLEIEPLPALDNLQLDIAWTQEPASTTMLVSAFNEWAKVYRDDWRTYHSRISNVVRELLMAWKQKDASQVLQLFRENGALLRELGEKAGVPIETEQLGKLRDIANACGGAGKLSGAGGGDCGIGISFDKATSDRIRKGWAEAGLLVVDAKIDQEGVRVEK